MGKKKQEGQIGELVGGAIIDIIACEHVSVDGVLVYVSLRNPEGETFLYEDQHGNDHTLDGMRRAIEDNEAYTNAPPEPQSLDGSDGAEDADGD